MRLVYNLIDLVLLKLRERISVSFIKCWNDDIDEALQLISVSTKRLQSWLEDYPHRTSSKLYVYVAIVCIPCRKWYFCVVYSCKTS